MQNTNQNSESSILSNLEPIIIPVNISRTFIQNHPSWIFLYGNDLQDKGCLGQPWSCLGEPNCYSIPTARKLCFSSTDKFWREGHFPLFQDVLAQAIARIPKGKPVIPLRKIGEGCSRLRESSVSCYDLLIAELSKIKYPNIKIDWHGTIYGT
jgi:hypothetical protein